jgi:hypothetical protein
MLAHSPHKQVKRGNQPVTVGMFKPFNILKI